MSAGTLALPQIRLRRRGPAATSTSDVGLAFDDLDGPLLVVSGLVGGAGTTTLAAAIARQAARESAAPVLLTEREDTGGALATITGAASPTGVASLAAVSEPPRHAFAQLPDGTRLIAARRRAAAADDHEAVARLLLGARAAHGLVVVDGGRHDIAVQPLLAAATHILWVTRGDRTGVAQALATLPLWGAARQSLVVTATQPVGSAPRRALEVLAARLRERVVLVPYSAEIARRDGEDSGAALTDSLTAIARVVAR